MAKESRESLFRRLTRLFRSGPIVKRKVKQIDTRQVGPDPEKSSAILQFQKSYSPIYNTIVSNAFNLSERMARYQDFNEMEMTPEISKALDLYCLAGDNVIPLLDGTQKTVKQLFDSGTENFGVYSFDIDKLAIVPGNCVRVIKTGENQKIWRVNLDNDSFVRLTDQHLVLLTNGEYRRVCELVPGDSIRSLYTDVSGEADRIKGYERVLTKDGWEFTHRVVAKNTQPGKSGVIHHKNFNKRDNTPGNLEFMSWGAHQKLHADNNHNRWQTDPVYAQKMAQAASRRAKSLHQQPGWTTEFLRKRNEVFASYTPEQRIEKFARVGDKNGMFGCGAKLTGHQNGRWNDSYNRVISEKQIIDLIFADVNLADGIRKLNTTCKVMHDHMRSFGIRKWCKSAVIEARTDRILNDLKLAVVSSTDPKIVRKFGKLCKSIGVDRNLVYGVMAQNGYKNFGDFVAKVNHKVVSITEDGIEDVYDLQVDGCHNFAVTGVFGTSDFIFVHNSDETVAQDDKNRTLHIYSENPQVKSLLEDLFYDTLNVEFNLRPWVRNLVKYGDLFLYNDVHPKYGLINVIPIPVNELEREEGFDRADPMAVRFRWTTMNNSLLDNWEVTHIRLMSNDMFLPYGTSMIESARKIWRQLILIEDAMLVYRVVRAPERRVFYIDVGNTPPDEVPNYIEAARRTLRTSSVVDQQTSRVDIRYNPLPVHCDTPVPLLDGSTLTIENIAKKMAEDPTWVPWVYSVQDGTQRIVPGKVTWCGKNYTADELVRVWLDDNTYVDTAPEHPFVMRDGTSKRADELIVGESLMPLYRRLSTKENGFDIQGYETVYDPHSSKYKLTHRLVANSVLNKQREIVRKNTDWDENNNLTVHHIDVNRLNNSPDNLRWMGNVDHIRLHATQGRERLIRWNKSDKKKARVSQVNKERNSVSAMSDYNGSVLHASHNANRREAQKKSWVKNKAKRSVGMKWVIPDAFFVIGKEKLADDPSLNRDRFHSAMMSDKRIIDMLTGIQTTQRDIDKFSYVTWIKQLRTNGCSGFDEFKRSTLGSEYVARKNHKVDRIERIKGGDVYCMTVVGHDGQDDRHNFAVTSLTPEGVISQSAVIVRNSVDEDYIIPIRGQEGGTKIETLAGGQNTAAVEDVQYIQRKLFAALGIPKAYLGYDEMLSSKATLAQEDIRFSRTINVIQRTIISELNKMAIIHLTAHGFVGEQLLDFQLHLSNPSTVAQQQKLELWRTKFEIAGAGAQVEHLVDIGFLQKNVLMLTDEQMAEIKKGQISDTNFIAQLEAGGAEEGGLGGGSGGGGGGGSGGLGGEPPAEEEPEGSEAGAGESGGTEKEESPEEEPELELIRSGDDSSGEGTPLKLSVTDPNAPVKVQPTALGKALTKRSRLKHHGHGIEQRPDFLRMTSMKGHRDDDPYDTAWLDATTRDPLGESRTQSTSTVRVSLSYDMVNTLKKMAISPKYLARAPKNERVAGVVLTEGGSFVDEYDIDITIDGEDDDSDGSGSSSK